MRILKNAPLWSRLALVLVASEAAVIVVLIWYSAVKLGHLSRDESRGVQPTIESLDSALTEIVLVSAAGGLVVTGAAVLFVLRLGSNVAQIRESAVRFASGDLRHRIEPVGSFELRDLAGSLNRMAEQLSGQIALLQQQRNEQETILQSMQVGVIAIDHKQTVLSLNRVAQLMLGLTGAARGRRLEETTDQGPLLRFAADALGEHTDLAREFEIKSEPPLHVRAIAGNLRNAEGEPVGSVIILSDITHVRRLERLRTDFAANVSHELRTPITNIKGYVETLLEEGAFDTEHAPRFLGIIARNAERLGAIIDDMLALTTLERVQAAEHIATQPTPVGPLLHAVRTHLEPDAKVKSTRVLVRLDAPLFADVNSRLAEQAITNLVANAVKYGPENNTVEVTARPDKLPTGTSAVSITVADHGPGIPKEHLPRIFERVYRGDKARSRQEGGTGLGLAIAKHIALVHGGTIDAQSTVGEGSTFTIRLPRAEDPAHTDPKDPDNSPTQPRLPANHDPADGLHES